MLTFARFQGGLYLAEADLNDPPRARVGFLFQDSTRTDSPFVLSQNSWTDPQQQGYFVFFTPSSTRDWVQFASDARSLFEKTERAQFGWLAEDGASLSAMTLVLVANQGTSTPSVAQPFSLSFNNIVLTVQASPFIRSIISYDDANNAFQFTNANQNSIRLTAQPPNGAEQTFLSGSPFLTLPMDDTTSPRAGSVNAAFAFATTDLTSFEAGFMFFAPGATGVLTALNFPLLRAPGGATTPLGFSAWLDVLQPLVDTRSYFQCTDDLLGSYYTASTGQAFALTTTRGADASRVSRLVIANRPVNQPTDTGTYYLTPAGSFGLIIDGSAPAGRIAAMRDRGHGVPERRRRAGRGRHADVQRRPPRVPEN